MKENEKILVCGVIIGVLFAIFDLIIAIVTIPIYSPHSDLPIWKDPPNILAGIIFDFINGFILVLVYKIIYEGIPGYDWKKGANYGVIVGLFRVVMMSFSIIVMYDVPLEIVITGIVTGYIEIIVLCIILAQIFEKIGNYQLT
ncbi:MAG: hypothetical protein ACXAC7_17100 [Candidatus Hodarchaeales archaeon]|jgi:hypothetical protein